MIKFSIIINTHNQEQYIYDSVRSCLNQHYKNYEIILINSSKRKTDFKKFSSQENKRIRYFHVKTKYKQPELNQMNKILIGLKKSTGNYLVFMDGDDIFEKNKLSELNKVLKKNQIGCNQDLPTLIENNLRKKFEKKMFKYNNFMKYIFTQWPQVYGTSSILVKKNILKKFFDRAKPFKWKLLAIDAQIILFCKKHYDQHNYLSNLTQKRIHANNQGASYMNFFKKIFWLRRNMQFDYCKFIKIKNDISLDFIITKIAYFFLKSL